MFRQCRYLLRIAVGAGDFQLLPITDGFAESGKQREDGTAERIDGLPVVAYSHDFGVAQLRQFFDKIITLPRNILILVYDDIFVIELLLVDTLLANQLGRLVNHVLKIDAMLLRQYFLVFIVANFADVEK